MNNTNINTSPEQSVQLEEIIDAIDLPIDRKYKISLAHELQQLDRTFEQLKLGFMWKDYIQSVKKELDAVLYRTDDEKSLRVAVQAICKDLEREREDYLAQAEEQSRQEQKDIRAIQQETNSDARHTMAQRGRRTGRTGQTANKPIMRW
jgi:hypothetical protein